jgi:uncharacterized protein (DUF433 family)
MDMSVQEAPVAQAPEPQSTEHPHIDRVPGFCGGEPKIRGSRIAVWVIANWHLQGLTEAEIVEMYPQLSKAQVFDALSYYYDHQNEVDEVRFQNSEVRWQAKLGSK